MPLELKNFAEAFAVADAAGVMQPGKDLAKPAVMALVESAGTTYRSVPKAAEGVLQLAEDEAGRRLQWRIGADLAALVQGHVGIYGPKESAADPSHWDANLEECLEDYAMGTIREGIGQDGIGEAMTRLDFNMPEWGKSLTDRYIAGAIAGCIRDKTPAKALSSLGIVKADLEALVVASADDDISDVGEAPMDLSRATFIAVSALHGFAAMMGAQTPEELIALLGGETHIQEQLWSTEPALQASGLTALGAVAAQPAFALLVSKRVGYLEVFAAVFSADPVPTEAKPSRKARSKKNVPVGLWNEIAAELRAALPGKDGDKAEPLGMSRSAFANYATGKNGWEPTLEEYRATLKMLEAAGDALRMIHEKVRANEPEIPF